MNKSLLPLSLALLIYSCTAEKAPAPDTGSVTACDTAKISSGYVIAAIQTNCTSRSCHPGGNSPAVADFSTPEKLRSYINGHEELFRERVTGPQADMPQSQLFPALRSSMRDSIGCWISNGMPD